MAGLDSFVKLLLHGNRQTGLADDANTNLLLKMNGKPGFTSDGNTLLLLKFNNSIDGSQDFEDSSSYDRTITPFGSVDHDLLHVAFGVASGAFQGSNDYLELPDSDDWAFGTDDFTIEMFIKMSSSGSYNVYNHSEDINNRINFRFGINDSIFRVTSGGSDIIDNTWSAHSLVANTWYHVALVRNGTDIDLYIDGVKQTGGLTSVSASIPNFDGVVRIGEANSFGSDLQGYLNEYRISDSARYTGNFTPLRIFADSSSNSHDVTIGGNSPNSPRLERNTQAYQTHSADFDGFAAWLEIPDDPMWAFGSAFTLEMWAHTDSTAKYTVYNQWIDSNNHAAIGIDINANFSLWVRIGGVNIIQNDWDLSTLGLTNLWWHHYALVKNGSNYDLYVNGTKVGSTYVNATAWPDIAAPVQIGENNNISGFSDMDGELDEYRISNTARYTSDFDPQLRFLDSALTPKTDIRGERQCLSEFREDRIKFNDGSLFFDGGDDGLQIPDSDDWFFNGDFTIDLWVRFSSTRTIVGQRVDASNYWIFYASTSTVYFKVVSIGVPIVNLTFSGAPYMAGNVWAHLAIQRSGNNYQAFIDGVQKDLTKVSAVAHINMPAPLRIGELSNVISDFLGNMDEIRISKGIARYSGGFTPPAVEYSVGVEHDVTVSETLGFSDDDDMENTSVKVADTLGLSDSPDAVVTTVFDVTVSETLAFSDDGDTGASEIAGSVAETLAFSDVASATISKSVQVQATIRPKKLIQVEAEIDPPALVAPTDVLTADLRTGQSLIVSWTPPPAGEYIGVDIYLATTEFGSYDKINSKIVTRDFVIIENLAVTEYFIKLVSKSSRGVANDSVQSLVSRDADLEYVSGSFRFTGPNSDTIGDETVWSYEQGDDVVGFTTAIGGTMTPTLDLTMQAIKKGPQYRLDNAGDFLWTSDDTLVTLENLGAVTGGIVDNAGGPGTTITDDQQDPDVDNLILFTDVFRENS